jgi:hypothetical protein
MEVSDFYHSFATGERVFLAAGAAKRQGNPVFWFRLPAGG